MTARSDIGSNPDPDSDGGVPWRLIGGLLVVVSVIGALLHVFAAPAFQPVVYELVRDSPILVFWWVPGLLLGLAIFGAGNRMNVDATPTYAGWFLIGVLVLSTAVTMPLAGWGETEHLADRTVQKMDTHVLSNSNTTLPDVDAQNLRNVPLTKAYIDAQNNFQKSKYKLQEKKECDITYINYTPFWSCALVADSGKVAWSGYQNGTALVSQVDSDADVYIVEGDVKKGLGVKAWRSNKWHLQRQDYWYQYQDNVFMSVERVPNKTGVVNGKSAVVRPLVVHNYLVTSTPTAIWWALLVAIGLFITGWMFNILNIRDHPVTIAGMLAGIAIASVLLVPISPPSFAGVAYQDANGSVTYLSPGEIQEHPELHDDNVYPYTLAEREIQALNWRQGLINVYWSKNGLFDLAGDASDNSYPYTVQGADKSKDYYFTTNPNGGGSGLKHIFVMDGQTGTVTQYKTGSMRFIGAGSAQDYIQGETPPGITNWNEYKVVEVMPVPHNGHLYWMGRIMKSGGPGLVGYAFVNASNPGEDIVFAMGSNKDTQARKFASGIPITGATDTTTTQTTTTNGTTITQIVVKRNGDVVGRYNVTGNTTIEFHTRQTNTTTSS